MYNALVATGQSNARIDAFSNCGAGCFVQVNADKTDVRVTAHHCHDRFCVPCQTARGAKISAALADHLADRTTRFLTLTQRTCDAPLADQLDKLYRDFRCLRNRAWWKAHVRGGAAFLEVKLGANSGAWHAHLHVLVEGSFLAQAELSAEWLAVTGASYIVDVRAVPNAESRARYVTKYVTKPADSSVFEDPAKLATLVAALKGRRLCSTFGSWRGLQLDPDDDTAGTWCTIGRVEDLFSSAASGDATARRWCDVVERKYPGIARVFGAPRPPPLDDPL